MTLVDELNVIAYRLDQTIASSKKNDIAAVLKRLMDAATEVGRAWSGSALGYHANVYYAGLTTPPADAIFDSEWGLREGLFGNSTVGDWRTFDPADVRATIRSRAEDPDMGTLRKFDDDATHVFDDCKMNALSILHAATSAHDDVFLKDVTEKIEKLSNISRNKAAKAIMPSGSFISREPAVLNQGMKLPPHLDILSEAGAINSTLVAVEQLAQHAKQAGSHISRQRRPANTPSESRRNVFVGHGRSSAWRELKDFIEDRLHLPVDEFNRVPVAGMTNIDRLSEMLETAVIAFLVMAGEDEQADGKMQARVNVVHEAGLFQGRLGFRRAIVVMEEDCEEFSNIEGLGQIRFPKNRIRGAFEDVRQVIEREGLL